jgi:hypothetical protein
MIALIEQKPTHIEDFAIEAHPYMARSRDAYGKFIFSGSLSLPCHRLREEREMDQEFSPHSALILRQGKNPLRHTPDTDCRATSDRPDSRVQQEFSISDWSGCHIWRRNCNFYDKDKAAPLVAPSHAHQLIKKCSIVPERKL